MTRNKPWTDEENDKVINAYLELNELINKEGANLAKFIRDFINKDNFTRNNKAVEKKFQNISFILDDIGCKYINNFKPLAHFQSSLKPKVIEKLSHHFAKE